MERGKVIAIIGIPGAGKTTLGNGLAKKFAVRFLEENWKSIPFFSKERKKDPTNFETCIGFLNLRYEQMQEAQEIARTETCVFIDTVFEMTDVYAKLILDHGEYQEFKKVFDLYRVALPAPDVYIHLTGDVNIIRERSLKRPLSVKNEEIFLSLGVLQKSESEIVNLIQAVAKGRVYTVDVIKEDVRTGAFLETFFQKILNSSI